VSARPSQDLEVTVNRADVSGDSIS
jgi:hypothetical protein